MQWLFPVRLLSRHLCTSEWAFTSSVVSLCSQRLRGAVQPLELYEVLREAGSRNRVELVDPGNLTPLIGRDTELGVLRDRWEQALEGPGQIVLLIGDAGPGKSRLIRELREHVQAGVEDQASVIELRCSQYHQNAAWFPLAEYPGRLLQLEHASSAERLERILQYLLPLGLDSAASVWLFCRVMGVPVDDRFPPLSLPPQRIKEQTEELLLTWLRRLVQRSAVLFIVEDLHWIDPSTLALVERHVELFECDRSLTVLTFRPEFETSWKSKQLGQYATGHFVDPRVQEPLRQFVGRLADVGVQIANRNAARKRPYRTLLPASIPQSINI